MSDSYATTNLLAAGTTAAAAAGAGTKKVAYSNAVLATLGSSLYYSIWLKSGPTLKYRSTFNGTLSVAANGDIIVSAFNGASTTNVATTLDPALHEWRIEKQSDAANTYLYGPIGTVVGASSMVLSGDLDGSKKVTTTANGLIRLDRVNDPFAPPSGGTPWSFFDADLVWGWDPRFSFQQHDAAGRQMLTLGCVLSDIPAVAALLGSKAVTVGSLTDAIHYDVNGAKKLSREAAPSTTRRMMRHQISSAGLWRGQNSESDYANRAYRASLQANLFSGRNTFGTVYDGDELALAMDLQLGSDMVVAAEGKGVLLYDHHHENGASSAQPGATPFTLYVEQYQDGVDRVIMSMAWNEADWGYTPAVLGIPSTANPYPSTVGVAWRESTSHNWKVPIWISDIATCQANRQSIIVLMRQAHSLASNPYVEVWSRSGSGLLTRTLARMIVPCGYRFNSAPYGPEPGNYYWVQTQLYGYWSAFDVNNTRTMFQNTYLMRNRSGRADLTAQNGLATLDAIA